jgi:hypothetical protein
MTTEPQTDGTWQQPDVPGYAHGQGYNAEAAYYQQPAQTGNGQQYSATPPSAGQYTSAAPQPPPPYGQPAPQALNQGTYAQMPYQQSPPAQPPYGGYNGSGYYGPAGGVAYTAPTSQAPGIGMIIAVTALFGLLGLIPTTRRAKKAQALGLSGGKYWKTFGATLAATWVFFIILSIATSGSNNSTATEATPAQPAGLVAPVATAKPVPATSKPTVHAPRDTYTKLSSRSWLQIVKNPEGHVGEKVIIYGQIYQFDNFTGTDAFMAIAGPSMSKSDSDANASFVGDAGLLADFVKDDTFRAEAVVVGADNYRTQAGGITTAPRLQIVSIKKT